VAPQLFLIDGNSLVYRAFFALPDTIATSKGEPTNAIFGFASMLVKLLTEYGSVPTLVVWDAGWSGREEVYTEYKAERKSRPDLLRDQWPALEPLVEAFGYRNVRSDGFEADDVIATLAGRYAAAGAEVDVVSGDRDLIDLATDRVRVIYTGKGMANLVEFSPAEVQAQYGIPPGHYADFAILRGDPSDGLPGVPGVGVKTAALVVSKYGRIEEILAAARSGALSGAVRSKVLAAADYLAVAPAVVRGRTDVEIPALSSAIPATPADPEMLAALAETFGLESPVERLTKAIASVHG